VTQRIVLVSTFAFSALGCGGSVNQQNFEKLKVGMTSTEVQAILGKEGKEVSSDDVASLLREALSPRGADGKANAGAKVELPDLSGAKGVRWGDDKKSITIIYMGDRVNRVFKKGF
jgi:hypothetical protein